MKKIFLFIAVTFCSLSLFSQSAIRGIVKAGDTNMPLSDILVTVQDKKITARTDENGRFRLNKVTWRKVVIVITAEDYQTYIKEVDVNDKTVNLGEIVLNKPEKVPNQTDAIQVITLDDADSDNDVSSDQNVSSQIGSSRNLFRQLTSFNWGAIRYRQRGYLNNYTEQYFNGVPFNELDDERVAFNSYGGLNDVTRNPQYYVGLEPNSFAFGDLAGSFSNDTRASFQRKQKKISYMNTNGNFNHRIMATYSTGLTPKGWALTLSGSRRWAQEGYVPGTFMDAFALLVSADKKLNNKHLFNITAFSAPIKQGRSGSAVEEMYTLSGTNFYNPYWGYQNGEKRNARVSNINSPTVILRHDYTPNKNFTLTSAFSFQAERAGQTDLDWYNAPDPRPDYYSKLPSATDDLEQKDILTKFMTENESARQINWYNMYNINRSSLTTINNATIDGQLGQSITGNRSKYVLFDRRNDSKEANFYTNLQYQIKDNQQLVGGIGMRYFKGEDFKVLKDLLGGDYFVDVDQFAERDFPGSNLGQNNLQTPNNIVKLGDKYGYNYETHVRNAFAWGQYSYATQHFDFFASAKGDYTSFWREGFMQNGRFPKNSFGKSTVSNFLNYGTKAGVTYKMNGRNYFHVYAGYLTKAPHSRDAFLSPRTRNELASNLKNEKISSFEAGYNYRSPNLVFQATAYLTNFKDKVKAFSFYSDEDRSFVNYVAKGLNSQHAGIELAAEYKVTSTLKINCAGTLNQNVYTSRPTATATPDNGVTSVQSNLNGQTVYINGYYIPNAPQLAGTVGFKYFGKKYWSFFGNFNYFANRYMDINFNRRTDYAVSTDVTGADKLVKGSPLWNEILEQKKLPNAFTLNLSGRKSIRIKYDTYLDINIGVNNVLNSQIVAGAFEQWRFNWTDKNINTFPPKYFYAYGINYIAMVTLRF
jgi:hypothetical protein